MISLRLFSPSLTVMGRALLTLASVLIYSNKTISGLKKKKRKWKIVHSNLERTIKMFLFECCMIGSAKTRKLNRNKITGRIEMEVTTNQLREN